MKSISKEKKIQILKIAKEVGKEKAASIYGINRKSIYRWEKLLNEGKDLEPSKRSGSAHPAKIPDEVKKQIIRLRENHKDLTVQELKNKFLIKYSLNTIYRILRDKNENTDKQKRIEFYLKYSRFEVSGTRINYILFIQNITTKQTLVSFTEDRFNSAPVTLLEYINISCKSFFPKYYAIKTDLNLEYYKDLKDFLSNNRIEYRQSKNYIGFERFCAVFTSYMGLLKGNSILKSASTSLLLYNMTEGKNLSKDSIKIFHKYRPVYLDLYNYRKETPESVADLLLLIFKKVISLNKIDEGFSVLNVIYQHLNYFNDKRIRVKILLEKGILFQKLNNVSGSIVQFKKALKIAQKEHCDNLICLCEGKLAIHYNLLGKKEKAVKHIMNRIDIAGKNNFKEELSGGYLTLGVWEVNKNNLDKAKNCYEKVLEISSDRRKRIKAMANIGVIEFKRENLSLAREFYISALSKAEEDGDFRQCAWISGNIGITYSSEKKLIEAKKYYLTMLKYSKFVKEKHFEYNALNNLGTIEFDLNNYEEAFKYYYEVYEYFKGLENGQMEMICCFNLAEVLLKLNKNKKSIEYLKKALIYAKKFNDIAMIESIEKLR